MLKHSIKAPVTLAGLVCLSIGVASAQPAPDGPRPQPDGGQPAPQRDDGGPSRPGDRQQRNQQPGRGGMPGGPMGQMGGPGGGQMGPIGMMPPGMAGMGGMGNVQMQDATYLGVEVSAIDPAMKSQLKLTKTDSGLMVNFVADSSPAKAAGLQQYDVLTKVDDQILFNAAQLQSLVRIHKAGDEVKITYIREGTANTASAKLDTKQQMVQPSFGGPWGGGPGMPFTGPTPEMQQGMRQAMEAYMGNNNRTVTYEAENMSLTIKTENGKPILTATDKGGKELFNGTIETPEQREAIPADVRKGLDKVAVNYLITSLTRQGRPMGFGGGGGGGGGFGGGPAGGGFGGGNGHGGHGPGGQPGMQPQDGPGAPPAGGANR